MVLEIGLWCGRIENSDLVFSDFNCYLSERTTTTICCTPAFVYIHVYVY